MHTDSSRPQSPPAPANSIEVAGIRMDWDLARGRFAFEGLPTLMMWVDSTLASLMSGLESMVGPERFALALQAEGRKSVEEDWQVIASRPDFRSGFEAIRRTAGVAGWGDWELVELDVPAQRCVIRAHGGWEGLYQKKLGVCWGSGLIAGKFAAYCTRLFGTNCWSRQTAFLARGDAFDEFVVTPSSLLVEEEIGKLLATDRATRADLAVALRKQQESERRLRVILDNAPLGIWMQNSEGKLEFVNRAFCESVGISEESFRAVAHYSQLFDEATGRSCMASDAVARAAPGPQVSREKLRFVDGELHDVEIVKLRLEGEGRAGELIGISMDISARLRAEAEKARLEEQLRQTQKLEAIGTLAGGIAHDFNNILAVIRGNTTLALHDVGSNPPVEESLQEIQRACLRAEALVRQILAFGRPRASDRRTLRLGPVIEESLDLLRHTIPAVVELAWKQGPDVPQVQADPAQMGQVLVNLCTNAWHALEDQPGRIEIRLERHVAVRSNTPEALPAGTYACLSVRDSGAGMDALTRERIFEPFFTTKSQGRGTGLGLSVVHGIVQSHQGHVRVESEPGRGSCFSVFLPAVDSEAQGEPPAAEAVSAPGGRGRHVLFLDDEDSLVFLARRVLERTGYRVSAFTRPSEALASFRADPRGFDLVVTDLNMPGVSGLEIAREMLALRSDLPVLLASGYLNDEIVARAKAQGIEHVIFKPGTVEEFVRLIDERMRREARR